MGVISSRVTGAYTVFLLFLKVGVNILSCDPITHINVQHNGFDQRFLKKN